MHGRLELKRHHALLQSFLFLLFLTAGCSPPVSREQLLNEVTHQDPKFARVLERHQELLSRIATYEKELTLKRETVEHAIAQMRKDLEAAAASVKARIAEAKKQLEPQRQQLNAALAMASGELRVKRLQRSSFGRSIAQLRKAIQASQGSDEARLNQTQLDEMMQDARQIDIEIRSLREHIRLLRLKLYLIRL
ncbi:MAG: hypothetical protein HYT88_05655 [Candidatus Omnitrophica bacterium]|nr:hypothetical protein [Candidatus Omnitrophota bacterium]MBI2174879.1 hypothetical protein [Candidatus Omnitrophota bacterium]